MFFLWRRYRIEVAPAAIYPLLGLVFATIATPSWLLGNWGNDFRLMVPLVCLLIAGTNLRIPERRFGLAFAAAVALVFGLRVAPLTQYWLDYDRLFGELRAAAGSLEPGSRVLPAVDNWHEVGPFAPTAHYQSFDNIPALLALDRDVYLPTLFTTEGRQPLSVSPAYAETDVPHGNPMRLDRLRVGADPGSADELYRMRGPGDYSYLWADWPNKFDYLLMLEFEGVGNPLPEILSPHHRGSYFTIYRVCPPAKPAAPGC